MSAMKKIATLIFAVFAAIALAGCSATERGAAIGATTGAIVGGVATGTATGAAAGAVGGGIAGAVIGHIAGTANTCLYEDYDGTRYRARCPEGATWD
jgi:hypothetical protein